MDTPLRPKKTRATADERSIACILKNAKQYQVEASGDSALSFEKGDVSWDNFDKAGKLVERKYGYGSSVFNEREDELGGKIITIKCKSREKAIIDLAKKQVEAAGEIPLKWEISTELGARGIRKLFDSPRNVLLKNIEVVYVPQVKIIQ